jgi:hypothetical protein
VAQFAAVQLITANEHWLAWSGPLAELSGYIVNDDHDCDGDWDWEYRRGFVEHLLVSWAGWRAHHSSVHEAVPLTDLAITHTVAADPGHVAETCRWLKRLTVRGGGSDIMRWVRTVQSGLPHVEVIPATVRPVSRRGLADVGEAIRRTSPRRSGDV